MHHHAASPFLDQLGAAKQLDVGIFLFDQFIPPHHAENAFQMMNADFPWELNPRLYGYQLSQHAYHHIRSKNSSKQAKQSAGLAQLEELCAKIETQFDGKVSDVYCNRFKDPEHHIPYHTDTFGKHILVISLGSTRTVAFRNKKTKTVTNVTPNAGDLYFMPLGVNNKYEHSVCAADNDQCLASDGNATRLSFVFFFDPPKYAKEYKISTGDKIRGFLEGVLA